VRALIFTEIGKVEIGELKETAAAFGEVVVSVELVGICGSDLLGYQGRSRGRIPPLVLGHEFVGRARDQRVVVNPIVSCGRCEVCLDGRDNLCPDMTLLGLHCHGAMRERVNVPAANVIAYAAEVPDERMALCEPFACGLHSLDLIPFRPQTRSLVIGFGCLGSMIGCALQLRGAEAFDVVEPSAARRALAGRFGGRAVEASDVGSKQYDFVFDCAGYAETRAMSARAVKSGGHIVLVGYGEVDGGIDFVDIVRREYHVHGVMAYTAREFRDAAEILASGRVTLEDLVCTFPLEDGQAAFDAARACKDATIKTLLRVHAEPGA
jgi:alcohol dehydrogenase